MLKVWVRENTPQLYMFLRRCKATLHDVAIRVHLAALTLLRRDCDVLVVVGMRRTGNHAVISWIKEQCEGSFLFYNNINPECSPFSARMTEHKIGFSGKPLLVFSYEDQPSVAIDSPFLDEALRKYCRSPTTSCRTVLILRDPYNLFASRLKKWPEVLNDPLASARMVNLWKNYAKEFGATHAQGEQRPLTSINYNQFILSETYRKELSNELGLNFSDAGLQHIPVYGHGSSFDVENFERAAVNLDVTTRWTFFKENDEFWDLFDDSELQRLSKTIFRSPELPQGRPKGASACSS